MEAEIKNILLEVCGPDALAPDVDLIDSGILDSLAFIELLSSLEDMGIELQPTQIARDEFRTVDKIVKLAENYKVKNIKSEN